MNQLRRTLILALALTLLALAAVTAAAQQVVPDRDYEVTLQLVIGSKDGAKAALPANLGPVSKSFRSLFDFDNYRLATTFVGRMAYRGTFEYKSITDINGRDLSSSSPTFVDWSLRDLRPGDSGKRLQAETFRFGARVPVVVGGDASKGQQVVNYENVGLTVNRAGFSENTPTLIGTLHLPGTSGTIFLVVTVRPTEN